MQENLNVQRIIDDALATLNQADGLLLLAVEIIVDLLKELEIAQKKIKWIGVEKEQPDHSGIFLCRYDVDVFGSPKPTVEPGVFHVDTGWNSKAITHWMELPDATIKEDEP